MLGAVAAILFFGLPDFGQSFGIPVRTVSALDIHGQADRRRLESGNELLAVHGEISNQTDEVQHVPQIRAELKDGQGRVGLRLVDRAAGARAAGARPRPVRQRPDGRAARRPHAQPQLRADLLMRIGILTGGGDVPGLNACIRSVTLSAVELGWDVIGFRRGWEGVMRIDPDDPASIATTFASL